MHKPKKCCSRAWKPEPELTSFLICLPVQTHVLIHINDICYACQSINNEPGSKKDKQHCNNSVVFHAINEMWRVICIPLRNSRPFILKLYLCFLIFWQRKPEGFLLSHILISFFFVKKEDGCVIFGILPICTFSPFAVCFFYYLSRILKE